MRNFQDTIEIRKQSFIRGFSMCTTLPFNNLTSTPYVTARIVAQIICKIISTIIVVGNIKLRTRYLFWHKHSGIHFSMYFITISV